MDHSSGYWITAPYGRACASCAQAKCKCLVAEAGGSCARCRRLNRECQPAPRTRKANPMRKSVAAKTAQLERRLDELTTLLQTTQPTPVATTGPALSASGSGSPDQAPTGSPPGPHTTPPTIKVSRAVAEDSYETDQEILDDFCTNRLPYLPFMYIPLTTCAAMMKKESPFLWKCLVTLHCRDTLQLVDLHQELKTTAAQALLVECQRSLDLLQGLIVYLAWIGFGCQPRKVSLGPFMQMAIGLVLDIGLNKTPPQSPDIPGVHFIRTGAGSSRPWVSLVRTMEERRAVLGCFLVCSCLSHTLGRTDSLRWTPHMKECLDILAEAKEVPGDAMLVELVRMQLVVDKVIKELGNDFERMEDGDRKAPLSFYLQGLQSQIDEASNRSPELYESSTLRLQLYHAETTIYESALVKTASTEEMDFTRIDHLYSCLNTVRKRFDVLLGLPTTAFAYFPSTILFPTAHSFIALLRLSTFEYPGWDRAVVRHNADLIAITKQVADTFSQAAVSIGMRNPPGGDVLDSYTTAARILMGLRAGWAARLPDLETTALPQEKVPPLPEIDPEVVESWLSSQDLIWLTNPLFGGAAWGQ